MCHIKTTSSEYCTTRFRYTVTICRLSVSHCLPVCLCLSVSVCICLYLSVSACICLYLSVSVCICLSVSVSQSVSSFDPFPPFSLKVYTEKVTSDVDHFRFHYYPNTNMCSIWTASRTAKRVSEPSIIQQLSSYVYDRWPITYTGLYYTTFNFTINDIWWLHVCVRVCPCLVCSV